MAKQRKHNEGRTKSLQTVVSTQKPVHPFFDTMLYRRRDEIHTYTTNIYTRLGHDTCALQVPPPHPRKRIPANQGETTRGGLNLQKTRPPPKKQPRRTRHRHERQPEGASYLNSSSRETLNVQTTKVDLAAIQREQGPAATDSSSSHPQFHRFPY